MFNNVKTEQQFEGNEVTEDDVRRRPQADPFRTRSLNKYFWYNIDGDWSRDCAGKLNLN